MIIKKYIFNEMYIAQLVSLNSFTTKIIIKNKKLVKMKKKRK